MLYFILGGSGIGKTTTAQKLSELYDLEYIRIDQFREEGQLACLQSEFQYLLHDTVYVECSQEELLELHTVVSEAVSGKLANYINSLENTKSYILEGDDITLELVHEYLLAKKARAVCIAADSQSFITDLILDRQENNSGISAHTLKTIEEQQFKHAYLNGKRIAQAAAAIGIPVVYSQPLPTLASRCEKILELGK